MYSWAIIASFILFLYTSDIYGVPKKPELCYILNKFNKSGPILTMV